MSDYFAIKNLILSYAKYPKIINLLNKYFNHLYEFPKLENVKICLEEINTPENIKQFKEPFIKNEFKDNKDSVNELKNKLFLAKYNPKNNKVKKLKTNLTFEKLNTCRKCSLYNSELIKFENLTRDIIGDMKSDTFYKLNIYQKIMPFGNYLDVFIKELSDFCDNYKINIKLNIINALNCISDTEIKSREFNKNRKCCIPINNKLNFILKRSTENNLNIVIGKEGLIHFSNYSKIKFDDFVNKKYKKAYVIKSLETGNILNIIKSYFNLNDLVKVNIESKTVESNSSVLNVKKMNKLNKLEDVYSVPYYFYDVQILFHDKVIFIFLTETGDKIYYEVPFEIEIYQKDGNYSDCDYIESKEKLKSMIITKRNDYNILKKDKTELISPSITMDQ